MGFNFFQFQTLTSFSVENVDLCIPCSSLLTKAFYFLVTLCRCLRNFLWSARLKNHRSAVNPHQLDCPFPFPYCICMLFLGVYIFLANAKFVSGQGIPKEKPFYHNYPFQLVLILSLERFPAKDYWGLVLARKRKKKAFFPFFLSKEKPNLKQSNISVSKAVSAPGDDIAQSQ